MNDDEAHYQGARDGSHNLTNAVHWDTWACRMWSTAVPEVGVLVESALGQRLWRFAMLAVVECKILVQKNLAHDPFKESDFVDSREEKKEDLQRDGGRQT